MKLVERCSGLGVLLDRDAALGQVTYRIERYQGMSHAGLPIPGLHRIEGSVDLTNVNEARRFVGADLGLKLEDGRTLRVTLADADGRVLTVGHGPKHGCACC
jgi:hypothetical protein